MYDSDHQGGGLVKKSTGFMTNVMKSVTNWRNRVVVVTDTLCLLEQEEQEEHKFTQENFAKQLYFASEIKLFTTGDAGMDL